MNLFCMQFFVLFWLVLDSNLVNVTDFMVWNVKDFTLTEWKLLLFSTWLGMGTSSSLCVLCICHAYPIYGVLVLFASAPFSSSIPLWNGSAYHMPCTSYQTLGTVSSCVLYHSIYSFLFLNSLFCSLGCCLSAIFVFLPLCICSKSFMIFISSNTFFCTPCASTHWIHIST